MLNESGEPRYGRASVNGQELAWAEWGAPNAPADKTMVAAHGITANLHTWDALAPDLTNAGYRLIGYDLRGRGDSSKPTSGYSAAHHAADLLALLNYFNLKQVNVVGHSLGALIGMYFAVKHPERVRRLVLIDHGADTPPDAREAIGISLGRLGRTFDSIEDYVNLFKNAPMYPHWTPELEQFTTYDVEVRADGKVTSRVAPAAIEEEISNLAQPDYLPTNLQAQLRVPTLLLRAVEGTLDGGKRGFILTAEGAAKANQNIAGSKLVAVSGVNHYTITLDPTPEVAGAIIEFLA